MHRRLSEQFFVTRGHGRLGFSRVVICFSEEERVSTHSTWYMVHDGILSAVQAWHGTTPYRYLWAIFFISVVTQM
jgi:hypothetical protein